MLDFDKKIVVVTGCGSIAEGIGNGRATAMLFARAGAHVIGTDVNLEAAEETAELISKEGGKIEVLAANSMDHEAMTATMQDIIARHGYVDVVVNNVGQSEPGGPFDMSMETWQQQFAINVDTAFTTIKAVLPSMRARQSGAIVNISSIAGMRYIGKPQVGYAASKAALVQMTKTTAVIEAPHNIRLNCVVPGLMNTPLMKRLADKYAGGDLDGLRAKRNAQVPMGRMGESWDVANAVLFLASDKAKYITGTELVVDGGITATTP